jgi:hypothetical protein
MTQALNLANFANNLNTSGATTNAGLQNSAVTVTAGTGMSGGGSASLGGSVTLTNAGVTSIVAGTGISINTSTGAVTITNASTANGTVTSVSGTNGLTGTVTTSGSLSLDYYTGTTVNNTSYPIGSYLLIGYSGGAGFVNQNASTPSLYSPPSAGSGSVTYSVSQGSGSSALSGTWRSRGQPDGNTTPIALIQRTA